MYTDTDFFITQVSAGLTDIHHVYVLVML